MNVVKYLHSNNFITTVDDKVIDKINDFEEITSIEIMKTKFSLFQAIKILGDFEPECAKMVIQYLINIEKITLNLFVFFPDNLKEESIRILIYDLNYLTKNIIVSNKILDAITSLENDPTVLKYNKSIYDIKCITTDEIVNILSENKNTIKDGYIPISKTAYRSNYDFCLHKLILLLFKLKVLTTDKTYCWFNVVSYGDLAVLLYMLYFPVIKIKSYVGKIFYDTFQSFLIEIGFLDYFGEELESFRDKLKLVADFIICSGHTDSNPNIICDEEFKEFNDNILKINYKSRVSKILKKHKSK